MRTTSPAYPYSELSLVPAFNPSSVTVAFPSFVVLMLPIVVWTSGIFVTVLFNDEAVVVSFVLMLVTETFVSLLAVTGTTGSCVVVVELVPRTSSVVLVVDVVEGSTLSEQLLSTAASLENIYVYESSRIVYVKINNVTLVYYQQHSVHEHSQD